MAMQPAILGTMRLGNARLGYEPAVLAAARATRVRILINGVIATSRVRMKSVAIRDVINETPSTCDLTIDTSAPSVAQSLRVQINSDTPRLLFNGVIQSTDQSYEAGRPANLVYPTKATDDLERLKRRRPFGTWANISATTIVQALVASFAPGFTTTNVQAGLPALSINLDGAEGFDGALKQIAGLIGGYYYIEDLDVHLFTSESTDLPDPIDSTHRFSNTPSITITQDLSQLRTRVYGKGHGEPTPTDVLAGEAILPVASADMFNPLGGRAIALTQRLTYTGLQQIPTNGGSLVGPGASPSVAPSGTATPGSAIGVGDNNYAYTFITGAGESLASPAGTVTTFAHMPAPATAPVYGGGIAGSQAAGFYGYAATFVDGTGETTASPVMVIYLNLLQGAFLTNVVIGPSGTTSRKMYRTQVQATAGAAATAQLKFVHTIADNTTTTDNDTANDAALGANVPTSNTAAAYRNTSVAGIAVGPTGTTNRKLYRRRIGVNGDVFRLLDLGGLGDNTTTTYSDTTSDGTIAAHVSPPSSDTSGLTQSSGQVLAGSTSIETASSWVFSTSGGWALVGSQAIRYTGISGNTLTGIPTSGAGSLVSTVRYGEHIDPAPALTGVSGITVDIPSGTTVNLWVQRDDTLAQAAMAAIDGGDGIYEYYVSDERRGEPSLTALCDANLALYKSPIVTAKYATRDVKTKSGKPVTITNILGYTGTLTIQDVTISEIDLVPATAPKFMVTASSVRVSLEALLRQMLGEVA